MYRVIEYMRLKDGTNIDRVRRYEYLEGKNAAKAELHQFLYESAQDDNLAYALATIMDDEGAIHKVDDYKAREVEQIEG